MADLVRQAREDLVRVGLLGDVSTDGVVPDLIVRSWRRSLSGSVDSAAPCQRYSDIDTDSILRRAADPVLDRWQNHLADTGATLFLSDRAGNIVARRTSDSGARRRLDSVHAAEGFDYSEDSVGTNGLGTSMVEGRALLIAGQPALQRRTRRAGLCRRAGLHAHRRGDRLDLTGWTDRRRQSADALAHPRDRPADRRAATQHGQTAGPRAGHVIHAVHQLTAPDGGDGS